MTRGSRKASINPTVIFTAAGWVLAAFVIVWVVVPMIGGFIGIPLGSTAEAASSIDNGFANLIQKVDLLSKSPSGQIEHTLTVDKGFYLVSFNRGGAKNGEAVSPPECGAQACLCVCISDDCEKIDARKNKGRDCRPLYAYDSVVVSGSIDSNKGGSQLYIKGAKTISMKLEKRGNGLYLVGK